MKIGIPKMIVVGVCLLIASGAVNGWPLTTERKADGLQKRMTECDKNIDELIRFHDGEAGTATRDRKFVEGNVKACLSELKNYFYVTVARTKLKARGVSGF